MSKPRKASNDTKRPEEFTFKLDDVKDLLLKKFNFMVYELKIKMLFFKKDPEVKEQRDLFCILGSG